MGLELLEEKYEKFHAAHSERIPALKKIAAKTALIQLNMRALLDGITGDLCGSCNAPCCQCMPVDGWFTEGDYFVFRMAYDAPFALRVDHDIPNGCTFLGAAGCVLPADIRPFPCVKVNCKSVADRLEHNGTAEDFKRLYDELDNLQEELWYLLNPQEAASGS